MLGDQIAESKLVPALPSFGISIKLEDAFHGSQRYTWKNHDVLEIAARHPSLKRYLGPKNKNFPGQESQHFRVLLAEIVSDAVCARLLGRNIETNPSDYVNADWDLYYLEFSDLMSNFLPKAHELVVPDID